MNVIYDLRIFLLFYTILVFLFGLMFSVIGVGLDEIQNLHGHDHSDRRRLKPKSGGGSSNSGGADDDDDGLIPPEYKYTGMFVGQFLSTLRLSIGDFASIETAAALPKAENILFWHIWFLAVILTNVVFLNFIVAEASASYAKVTETLEAVI